MRKTLHTAPLLLALALAAGACLDATGTGDPTAPLVRVLEPAGADSVLAPGPVRVRAHCFEDRRGGCTLEVFLDGNRVAQGADSIDVTVSLAPFRNQAVQLVVQAVNPRGRIARETRTYHVVEAPELEVIAPVDTTTPANPVRLAARCRTDHPQGCTLEVFLEGDTTPLAAAGDSLDALVPLPDLQGDTVRFVFVARGGAGATTTAESPPVVVPAIVVEGPASARLEGASREVRRTLPVGQPPEVHALLHRLPRPVPVLGAVSFVDPVPLLHL